MNINESKKQCLKALQKSTHSGKKNFHKGYVCIVCDQFIVGKEKVCWVNMKILLANEERLSVDKYQNTFQCVLPDTLRKQYLISSNALLNNMLLSPRASLASSRDKIMEKKINIHAVTVVKDHFQVKTKVHRQSFLLQMDLQLVICQKILMK